jgi:hypothetical protein
VLRRFFLALLPAGLAAGEGRATLRGRLQPGSPGRFLLPAGETLELDGDEPTRGVFTDARLKDADMDLTGEHTAPGKFKVDPRHTKAMWVHKDGRRLQVSYYCDVCSIRTYAPGVCMCCQDETALDLKESFDR